MGQIVEIGLRLKAERERQNLSQVAFGVLGGVTKTTQFNYERGERKPDAEYLAKLAIAGIDVGFVLTGIPSDSSLTPDEIRLLILFRSSSIELKAAALAMLDSGSTTNTGTTKQVFYGSVGQRIEGDSHGAVINMGSGSVTATTNTKTKKKKNIE